ncbi:hypothetical protein [Phenylobacterium sp. 58.2.17]|uniref:hypothetical protein n=1 Tax=Phenylobacterium sp. 58.2.17 TaxID=2969306 RepID=UPI0022648FAF|nr:hypothetical protein [Phenylobacterium sp. 58.2.17]MCX7588826.1 hypothetical protein [Phenylobacterium sp. 58.2.17]
MTNVIGPASPPRLADVSIENRAADVAAQATSQTPATGLAGGSTPTLNWLPARSMALSTQARLLSVSSPKVPPPLDRPMHLASERRASSGPLKNTCCFELSD